MCARDYRAGVARSWAKRLLNPKAVHLALAALALLAGGWLDQHLGFSAPNVLLGWAAAIPWIVSGVSALASAYGANKQSGAQNKAANQQGDLVALQREAANKLMPYGQDLLSSGTTALKSLLPYYTRAAYGDRNVLSQLIQPEMAQIRENYDRPLQQLAEVSPSAGTTATGNAALIASRAEALNAAYRQARERGLSGLQGLASQLTDTGMRTTGAALGGLQGASGSNLGLLQQLFGIRDQNAQSSAAIGSALVDAYRGYQAWQAGRQPAAGAGTPAPAGGYSGGSGSIMPGTIY